MVHEANYSILFSSEPLLYGSRGGNTTYCCLFVNLFLIIFVSYAISNNKYYTSCQILVVDLPKKHLIKIIVIPQKSFYFMKFCNK